MKLHPGIPYRVLGLAAMLALPAPSIAQDTPVRVLRMWMGLTEEAGRFVRMGDFVLAEQRLNLAIKEIRPYYPKTQRLLARNYLQLARVLYEQERYAEAEPLAKWALSVREGDKNASPDAVFQCVYNLGLIEAAQEHYREAESLLRRALALQEHYLGPDHFNCILTLNQLASLYVKQEKLAFAAPLYARAITILERYRPDENLDLAEMAERYSLLLRRLKRYDEAERWNARAATIRSTTATRAARAKGDQPRTDFQGFK
jgi:tetratricopeptide (TPR) repeat protein